MTLLSPDQVAELLPQVKLSPRMDKFVQAVLKALGEEGTVRVAALQEQLYPDVKSSSANTLLNRQITTFNEDAQEQHSSLRLNITPNKKAGAAGRSVWFTGQYAPPSPLLTPAFDRIPRGERLNLQAEHLRPVVLLVTFNPNETKAVYEVFDYHPTQPAQGKEIPVTFLGEHGKWDVYHVISGQGNQAARTTVQRAIKEVAPSLVLACGIAFGLDAEKQQLGDVLCATAIVGYELGKVRGKKSQIQRTGDSPVISEALRARFLSVQSYFDQQPAGQLPPLRAQLGKLLSGEKLIDHQEYRDALVRDFRGDVIGGEMEGIGVHAAAQEMNNLPWGVVKAICDWADGNKNTGSKEQDQAFAARQAARFTRKLLETYPLEDEPGGRARTGILRPPLLNTRDLAELSTRIPDMQAVAAGMRKGVSLSKDLTIPVPEATFSINDHLLRWANAPRSSPVFALLGEYGMGKTIAAQWLASALDEQRQRQPFCRIPLLFDFREYSGLGKGVPTLNDILLMGAQTTWKARANGEPYTIQMIQEWIKGGAVLIFDGLDEALVKMNADDGQKFTRTLLRAFSDHYREWKDHREKHPDIPDPLHIPKILLTCRTQYFRTLQDQQNHFTGQERAGNEDDFDAAVLRPLTEEQVMTYLQSALHGMNAEQLLETIRAVQSLEELTQRPFTLKLVREFIPQIEALLMEGKPVYSVTLYRQMVRRWLDRDDGKHHVRKEDKLELATHIAYQLWTQGEGVLPANELERWFHGWMRGNPDLAQRYRDVSAEQLEEDLRNSTFLKRQDGTGGETVGFRFSHTSLQEFFLAEFLLRAIEDNAPERWNIRRPSDETMTFLGELLLEHSRCETLLERLNGWRRNTPRLTRALYFAYALKALERGWPSPVLHDADFSELPLHELKVTQSGLSLSGTSFAGSDLRESHWEGVNLRDVNFQGSNLSLAEFHHVNAKQADFQGANLHRTLFRHVNLTGSQWTEDNGDSPQFYGGQGAPSLPSAQYALRPEEAAGMTLRQFTHVNTLGGNRAYSPDGQRLALGGDVFKVLDARTGEPLFIAHESPRPWAGGARWSPDGRWIAVAGYELELRDATTYEVQHSFQPSGAFRALSWSPDGESLALVDDEKVQVLRLPDMTFQEVMVDLPHIDHVEWSPQDAVLALVTSDELAFHNLTTHTTTRFEYQGEEVRSVSWAPDGTSVVMTVRRGVFLVDATTGAKRNLSSSGINYFACFSPDGRDVLTQGHNLEIIDISGNERRNIVLPGFSIGGVAWSPDGESVAVIRDGLKIIRVRKRVLRVSHLSPMGNRRAVWNSQSSRLGSLSFNSSGKNICWLFDLKIGKAVLARPAGFPSLNSVAALDSVVLNDPSSGLTRINLTSGRVEPFHAENGGNLYLDLGLSPDGRYFYQPGQPFTIRETATGETLFQTEFDQGYSVAWSPDSEQVALCSDTAITIISPSGQERQFPLLLNRTPSDLSWSPDSSRVALLTDELVILNANSGEVLMKEAAPHFSTLSWSPDGQEIALAGQRARILDTHTGEIKRESSPGRYISQVAWSPDGKTLALNIWSRLLTVCASTLEPQFSFQHSDGAAWTWHHPSGTLRAAQGDAWRHLRWEGQDEQGQKVYHLVLLDDVPLPPAQAE